MIPGSSSAEFFGAAGAAGGAGYEISRSLRFNSSDSAYLSRTPASAGNRKTWTWAGWVKFAGASSTGYLFGNYTDGSNYSGLNVTASSSGLLRFYDFISGVTNASITWAPAYRDFSAWYHIVFVVDSTQATASDRIRLYINGSLVTTSSATYPALNADLRSNQAIQHNIGALQNTPGSLFNGYLADIHFIDGQALDPTSFGEFDDNGIWQPIEYSGTYGTNGFHLPFSDNSTAASLGDDTSGNNNDWTVNNISVAAGAGNDSLVDVPTNGSETDTGVGGEVRGNYCTWNPLCVTTNNTLTNGNLEAVHTASTGWTGNPNGTNYAMFVGTIGVTSGKWYWEGTWTSATTGSVGIVNVGTGLDYYVGYGSKSVGYTSTYVYNNGLGSAVGSMPSYVQNDIIGVAIDMDSGKLYFSKNGAFINSGDPVAGTGNVASGLTGETIFPAVSQLGSSDGVSFTANFGQRPFAYTAPSGFKALNTANLPAPVVTKPSEYMDVSTWTGNGGGSRTFTGLSFNPDLLWVKTRSVAYTHVLWDAVRGAGASKELQSDSTNAEGGASTNLYGYVSSFNSDGFSSTAGTSDNDYFNRSATTYVSWAWDAGSSTVTNTQGSITSTVRANPSAGFSIVTYTANETAGQTVGHGLGVTPEFFIFKKRSTTSNWIVVHKSIPDPWNNFSLALNLTDAVSGGRGTFSNNAPTSSVFSVSTSGAEGTNDGSATYVAYCFAPVEGYSAFGSYTGNGSADGPFVYTGFRPRWVMWKRTDSSPFNWYIVDTAREDYNDGTPPLLYPNLANAEAPAAAFDVLSNGFKMRTTGSYVNASGGTYIYAAFAENPFALNARAR